MLCGAPCPGLAASLLAEATRVVRGLQRGTAHFAKQAGPLLGFGCFVGSSLSLERFLAEERVFSSFSYEKAWRRCVLGSPPFLAEYDRLLEEVICPHLRGMLEEEDGPVAFYCQHPPTLRLQPGRSKQSRLLHADKRYGHQAGEVNFWMPLTEYTLTRTTLWIESAPGKGDFHPLEIHPGDIAMFHGTLVRHFVPPNRTEHTRVSLDFRIGVGQYFDPGWRMPGLRHYHPRRTIVL
ncbi:strG [Symbiodinium natans]|uniref:StrG protein n=1 Tax=Symbiodinium natans TaxID=878477 RepID=A0A812T4C6_9DINO|nr:strG [Symbiodinium natans]